jgi:hypothetical protein
VEVFFALAILEDKGTIGILILDALHLKQQITVFVAIIETCHEDFLGRRSACRGGNHLRRRLARFPGKRLDGALRIRTIEEHHKVNSPAPLAAAASAIENLMPYMD